MSGTGKGTKPNTERNGRYGITRVIPININELTSKSVPGRSSPGNESFALPAEIRLAIGRSCQCAYGRDDGIHNPFPLRVVPGLYGQIGKSLSITIGIFSNKWTQYAVGASILLLLLMCTVPFLQTIFNTNFMSLREWVVVLGLALIPAVSEEITKLFSRLAKDPEIKNLVKGILE